MLMKGAVFFAGSLINLSSAAKASIFLLTVTLAFYLDSLPCLISLFQNPLLSALALIQKFLKTFFYQQRIFRITFCNKRFSLPG